MHDNTVVMCVYFVKHPSLRQSRARLFTPLSVLAKTTRFSSLLFCRTKKPESVFIFSFPQTHSLVMFRILLRFWLAGGQRSIKSVWPVLVPLNIWHLHKPYIMPLSLRLPRFCMISLSFVGSIIHVQFGCSPSFFFFFPFPAPLQCFADSCNHQYANCGAAMLPASWSSFSSSCQHRICFYPTISFAAKTFFGKSFPGDSFPKPVRTAAAVMSVEQ